VELFVEDSKFCLDAEVLEALLCYKLVDLAEVVSLGDVSQGSVAPLGNVQILLLHCELGQGLPVGFDLGGHLQGLQDLDRFVQALVLKGGTELDQGLPQFVRDGVLALVDDDLGLALGSLNALHVTLNLIHSYLVGFIDAVPDAEIVAVLSDNDVGIRDPADVLAVVEQGLLLLLLDVVQVKLAALVAEKKLRAAGVQLQVVDL
jgi:hypothetical protein